MRPVDKGPAPKTYRRYQDAQSDLVDRVGDCCSYCERQIETNLAVEHVQPKSKQTHLRNEWRNFLLGCVNCNSSKGDKEVDLDEYFWPDIDNTFLAIEYIEDGRVVINPHLLNDNKTRAQNIIELVGLDKEPGHPDLTKRPTSTDIRWRRRQEVWGLAQENLKMLAQRDDEITRQLIVQNATPRGMFSIWMKVFENDVDMKRRLIGAFRGTSANCFDREGNAVQRPGGKL